MSYVEEFKSNLLLLLQCGHPEGLCLDKLEEQYKAHFQQDVTPYLLHSGNTVCWAWDHLFQLPEYREDFLLFRLSPDEPYWIKAIRKRTVEEMALIARLARHAHFEAAKKPEFHLTGCPCATCLQQKTSEEATATTAAATATVTATAITTATTNLTESDAANQESVEEIYYLIEYPADMVITEVVTVDADGSQKEEPNNNNNNTSDQAKSAAAGAETPATAEETPAAQNDANPSGGETGQEQGTLAF